MKLGVDRSRWVNFVYLDANPRVEGRQEVEDNETGVWIWVANRVKLERRWYLMLYREQEKSEIWGRSKMRTLRLCWVILSVGLKTFEFNIFNLNGGNSSASDLGQGQI